MYRFKFSALIHESTDAVIKQANWDSGKIRDKFSRDLDSHIAEVRTSKLSELTALHEVIFNFMLKFRTNHSVDICASKSFFYEFLGSQI